VFYPESVLPPLAKLVARAIPADHVFEGMRSVVMEGRMDWGRLGWATTLNLLYLALAAAVTAWVFRVALRRGLLPKVR
jgi:ABC-2 type transport system permease protein